MKLEEFKEQLIQNVSKFKMSPEDAFYRYEEAVTRSEDGMNVVQDGIFSQNIDSDFNKIFHEIYEESEIV